MIRIIKAATPEEYHAGAVLFKEYAESLDFTLSFQSFEDELTILPKMYGQATGALLLAESEGEFIGAVGLRQIENESTCEVKRMYIKPGYQGKGIGKALLTSLIDVAKEMEYKTIKLDTLGPKMPAAVGLYKSFGFKETTPYNYNPYEGVLYFEREL
ncbi:GNAT family N-acetyltransferase [Dyadobacter sp. NIV53]|uniref:GNAT family N-acetyltransferase n=1 Tax=Dyadobacter sp. NIV53 TaxID=2861765 RepID=UPI001C8893A8|nr:GNAT family N-acetyltransferase [Dyadobacter sp. NIV53]